LLGEFANTSPEEQIAEGDLEGTVSNKFVLGSSTYKAVVDMEKTRHIFPGRMCVFTELQMDPLTLHYVRFQDFKSALVEYHKLT
jgi:hypothetical protein